jgi:hypothetical protein
MLPKLTADGDFGQDWRRADEVNARLTRRRQISRHVLVSDARFDRMSPVTKLDRGLHLPERLVSAKGKDERILTLLLKDRSGKL